LLHFFQVAQILSVLFVSCGKQARLLKDWETRNGRVKLLSAEARARAQDKLEQRRAERLNDLNDLNAMVRAAEDTSQSIKQQLLDSRAEQLAKLKALKEARLKKLEAKQAKIRFHNLYCASTHHTPQNVYYNPLQYIYNHITHVYRMPGRS